MIMQPLEGSEVEFWCHRMNQSSTGIRGWFRGGLFFSHDGADHYATYDIAHWTYFLITDNRYNMSKQREAKERQGYVENVIPMVCCTCKHYRKNVTVREDALGGTWYEESDKRCGLGGFAVEKMGGCNKHMTRSDAA